MRVVCAKVVDVTRAAAQRKRFNRFILECFSSLTNQTRIFPGSGGEYPTHISSQRKKCSTFVFLRRGGAPDAYSDWKCSVLRLTSGPDQSACCFHPSSRYSTMQPDSQ